ncbi:hypothetical protein [Marinicrinis sediminis]|uniref:DUF3592 domain-containing protein n=1 Tax=Marinicrinis sediminis TaxID=1652465 RepID=A0ABW5RDD8_9BACL
MHITMLETGVLHKGTFTKWQNAFIEINDRLYVHVYYMYIDCLHRHQEVYWLVPGKIKYPRHVQILSDGNKMIILDFLPGTPQIGSEDTIRLAHMPVFGKWLLLGMTGLIGLIYIWFIA